MNIKIKIVSLAVAPLLLALLAIGALLVAETQRLERQQTQVLEDVLLSGKREELKNYVALALSSIDHLYGRDDEAAKEKAKAILGGMNFGKDGYFFVYDLKGRSMVHPRQRELVGRDLLDLRDEAGVYVVRELLARASEGGGFQPYRWVKPSTGKPTAKLGYAVMLPRWGWMMGTGIYLDDVDAAAVRMRDNLLDSVRQTLLGLAAVAGIALIVVFGGGVALNITQQRLADRKVKALAHRVVSSQEEERARVSRELHDHVCQMLVSIKYQFELVAHRLAHPSDQPVTAIDKEITALSKAISEVRQISHNLRPALLDDLGLPAALEQIGNELMMRTGLEVDVVSRVEDERLPEVASVNLFRVTQEALRNVAEHAQATHVDVLLQQTKDQISLRISDNGCGFDVQRFELSRDRGIGLSNMRERVERNGGIFRIRSQPGHTSLLAIFPLPPHG